MNNLKLVLRLLFFSLKKDDVDNFSRIHFLIGLAGTWIVGIGRYWDDDRANILQHLGLGSVIYIFCLSAFLWLIVYPFKVHNWTYFRVLTFISLTSFPAVFYAIPVERFCDIKTANDINVWFLSIVALWRLALLFNFLWIFTRLSAMNIFTVALLPICVIIVTLTVLNLQHVVFNIMGGIRNPTPHDKSYSILVFLTFISMLLIIPLIISYVLFVIIRRRNN